MKYDDLDIFALASLFLEASNEGLIYLKKDDTFIPLRIVHAGEGVIAFEAIERKKQTNEYGGQ